MKPQTIGIVGGAGPLAGALLLQRVLSLSGSMYGCYKDADFPKVLLLSFPFSDMLSKEINAEQLRQELSGALNQLRNSGASVLAIACNTLHAFLDRKEDLTDLIHLPEVVAQELASDDVPLVLCTSTSLQFCLHKQFFPCIYPSCKTQLQVDKIIEDILKGADKKLIIERLSSLLEAESASSIVLGCTELSMFTNYLACLGKQIIDPLELVAKKVLEKSFSNIRRQS